MSDLVVWYGDDNAAIKLFVDYVEQWANEGRLNIDFAQAAVEYAHRNENGFDPLDEITEEALDRVETLGLDGEAEWPEDGDPYWPRGV